MPDVDWGKVAESLERFEDAHKVRQEYGSDGEPVAFVEVPHDIMLDVHRAARWGLEAQQRGEWVDWCSLHGAPSRPLLRGNDVLRICVAAQLWAERQGAVPRACLTGDRLLVPLEAPDA